MVLFNRHPAKILKKWAKDHNKNYTTTNTQCEKIRDEYDNGGQWRVNKNYCSLTFSDYAVSTKSPEELAECFMYNYERPSSSCSHLENRKKYAKEWCEHFD